MRLALVGAVTDQNVFHVPQQHVIGNRGALDALKGTAHFVPELLQAGKNPIK
jgi:hypothetical protein